MDHIDNTGSFLKDNKMAWKRQFAVELERLWNAIATKEGLSNWFMPTKLEIEKRGRFSFGGGWDGTISEIDSHSHLQFALSTSSCANNVDGDSGAYLRFEIEANDDGYLFSLIDRMGEGADVKNIFGLDTPSHRVYQPGGPGTHWSGVAAGYHRFVDSLEDHITGNKIDSDYDEMCKYYQTVLDDHFGHGGT